jgi:REP element-mobilizing transposase RayT
MTEPAFCLEDPMDRRAVLDAIVEVCRFRQWRLMALHVRVTHLHGLVQAEGVTPQRVIADWKAYASRSLKQRWPERKHFWATGGNVRSIRESVEDALRYVIDGQGEPMDTYLAERSE